MLVLRLLESFIPGLVTLAWGLGLGTGDRSNLGPNATQESVLEPTHSFFHSARPTTSQARGYDDDEEDMVPVLKMSRLLEREPQVERIYCRARVDAAVEAQRVQEAC